MTLAAPVGCISYPIAKCIDTFNLCPTFANNFSNVWYYLVDVELDGAEFFNQVETTETRPFCLIVPDFPNGIRSSRESTFSRMHYAGTAWVKLEMDQDQAVADGSQTYMERMRWWDNLCGSFLDELGEVTATNDTALHLKGWHSYASCLSEEEKEPLQGSFFKTMFKVEWGSDI